MKTTFVEKKMKEYKGLKKTKPTREGTSLKKGSSYKIGKEKSDKRPNSLDPFPSL